MGSGNTEQLLLSLHLLSACSPFSPVSSPIQTPILISGYNPVSAALLLVIKSPGAFGSPSDMPCTLQWRFALPIFSTGHYLCSQLAHLSRPNLQSWAVRGDEGWAHLRLGGSKMGEGEEVYLRPVNKNIKQSPVILGENTQKSMENIPSHMNCFDKY